MIKKISFLFFLSLFMGTTMAQSISVGDRLKVQDADKYLREGRKKAAYDIFKTMSEKYPDNAEMNYKVGKAAFQLEKYNESLAYLSKAEKENIDVDTELRFWLGQAQHRAEMFDEALKNFSIYKSTLSKSDLKDHVVNVYITQVENAKKLYTAPVQVKIENLGEAINSIYRESNPSVTADGNTLIFTTCRPENVGGLIDQDNGVYFQDIWIAELDTNTGKWQEAQPIDGGINTKEHDASLSISPDGKVIFIYKSVGGGNVFYSRVKKDGTWRDPVPVEGSVNTSYFETSASITNDKKTMYFISERPKKGLGAGDIWMAKKSGGAYTYKEPVNISILNTIDDENSVFVHPNGQTLFFSSNGKGSIGGYDIFKSDFIDGAWSAPVNLGYPINTTGDEVGFTITADGNTAFLTSRRENTIGDYDIYTIDLTEYELPNIEENKNVNKKISAAPSVAILKGKVLDKVSSAGIDAKVIIQDEKGKLVTEVECTEDGDYFVILEGNKNYTMQVRHSDYATASEKVFMPETTNKSQTVTKNILMGDK